MVNLSDLVNRRTMMKFHRVIETKDINLLKDMLENNPQLIHPTYRNLDILTTDDIAQFFIEYGYLLKQLNPIYEVLTKNIPNGLKDKEEIELLLHVLDLKVLVETLKDPLRVAVRSGDLRWVELLLKNGAHLRGDIFNIAHNYAHSINQIFAEAKSNAVKVLSLVLKYDTDINKTRWLTILANNRVLESEVLIEMARILIRAGANINGEGSGQEFPLLYTLISRNDDLALFLVENGAELDYICPWNLAEGLTVLHHACKYADLDYISLLIEKGANITLTDSNGITPFETFMSSNIVRYYPDNEYDDYFKKLNKVKTCFIKEIARAKFENRKIIPSDLGIIRKKPFFINIYTRCNDQLDELKNTVFYPPYSFADVLGMRNKNIKKLVNLLKNEDFALNLEANLSSKNPDDLYYEDLNRIFKEAVIIRNKYNELELTLNSVLGKFMSTEVIILIIDYIKPQDLQLFV